MLAKDNNNFDHDDNDHDDNHDDDNICCDRFPEQVDVYETDSVDEVSCLIGDESTRSVVRKISKHTNDNKHEHLQLEPIERGNRGILIMSGSEDASARFSSAGSSSSTGSGSSPREDLLSLPDSSYVPSDIQSLDLEQEELSSVHCSMMSGRSVVVAAGENTESQSETMMNRSGTNSQAGTINHRHVVRDTSSATAAYKNDGDNDSSTTTVPRRRNVSVYPALALIALTFFFAILSSYLWISKRYWRHDALQLREELASMKELVNEMAEKLESSATTNEKIPWHDLQDDDNDNEYPHHVEMNLDNSWVEADACDVVGTCGNKEQAKEILFSESILFDKVSSGGNNNNSNNSNKRWWYNMKKVAACGGNHTKLTTTTSAASRLARGVYSVAKDTWRTVSSPVYQFENAPKMASTGDLVWGIVEVYSGLALGSLETGEKIWGSLSAAMTDMGTSMQSSVDSRDIIYDAFYDSMIDMGDIVEDSFWYVLNVTRDAIEDASLIKYV